MDKSAQALQLQSSLISQRQQAHDSNVVVNDASLNERTTMKRKCSDDNSPERATKKMRKFLSTNQTRGYKEERSSKRKARPEDDQEGARTRIKTPESPSQHYILISSGSEENKSVTKRKESCVARQDGLSNRAQKSQSSSEQCIVISSSHPSPAASSSANTFKGHEGYRETFEAKYMEMESLGSGGFGAVFAGYRREDMKPVAIKHIDQRIVDRVYSVFCESSEERSSEDKQIRAKQTFEEMMKYLSDFVGKCVGEESKYEGIRLLFDGFQQPLLNKQMTYVLLDIAVQELFPELSKGVKEAAAL